MKKPKETPMDIRLQGYEVLEKTAKQCATSGRVLVPKHWVGKQVKIVRLQP